MHIANIHDAEPFVTMDGSTIREVAGAVSLPSVNQSLAEATVPAGGATQEHFHRRSEELYYVVAGSGRVRLDGQERAVRPGDCVVIPPGSRHKLFSDRDQPLVLLCCCAPPYAHDDTVITE